MRNRNHSPGGLAVMLCLSAGCNPAYFMAQAHPAVGTGTWEGDLTPVELRTEHGQVSAALGIRVTAGPTLSRKGQASPESPVGWLAVLADEEERILPGTGYQAGVLRARITGTMDTFAALRDRQGRELVREANGRLVVPLLVREWSIVPTHEQESTGP